MFLMVGIVGAVSKTYDEDTQTVTIKDTFLFIPIGDIAEARLTTPLNNKVGLGYQKVAEFEVSGKKDWTDLFYREIKTYNKKTYDKGDETEINRKFDWKYKTTEQYLIDDYTCNKEISTNGTTINNCIISGNHYETREVWNDFDKNIKVKKDKNYTIGLFTNVQQGDYVEWIPDFAGKEVDEWATWTADLNTNLVSYYKLDESSGTVIDSLGLNNGSNVGATAEVTGKIGTAYNFTETENDYIDHTYSIPYGAFSITAWINPYGAIDSADTIYGTRKTGEENPLATLSRKSNGIVLNLRGNDGTSYFNLQKTIAITTGQWYFVTATYYANKTANVYVNAGTPATSTYAGNTWSNAINSAIGIESFAYDGEEFNGVIDEVGIWNRTLTSTEITQLYNNGTGISYIPPISDNPPTVTLISPANDSTFAYPTVTFTANATDDNVVQNVSLLIDGAIDQTNTSNVNGNYVFTKALTTGEHNWSILAFDNNSASTSSETRTITIDLIDPSINITSPIADYGTLTSNANLTLNFTTTDNNLDTCIWEYNGANTTISCVNATLRTEYFNYTLDVNALTVYANDSAGNWGSSTVNWVYRCIENSQTFQASVVEGSTTNILANISVGATYEVAYVNLIYNGTSSLVSYYDSDGFTILDYNKTLISVTSDTTFDFIWNVVFDDAVETNLTTQTQNVTNIGMDDCSVYSTVVLNLTLLDEDNQNNFTTVGGENSTIEINLEIKSLDETVNLVNITQKYEDKSPALVCINKTLTEEQYIIDATIKYSGGLHSIEYYNLQNFLMKNSTLPEVINLYDLNLSRATEFQVSYKNDAGIPQEDVLIQVSREYVSEGVFKVVEQPQTDSNGQTVVHLVQNDVRYNFIVSKDGTILAVLTNKVAFCEDATIGKCEVNLKEDADALEFYDYDEEFGISYTATYNETSKDIDFDFVSIDGTVKNVTLIITKFDMLGSSPLSQQSLTSTSGTITYTVPDAIGNATFVIDTYVDGQIVEEFTLETKEDIPLGKYGFVLFFFMFLSLIFMFSSSKSGLIIGGILGFVSAGLFSLQGIGNTNVLGSVIWLIVAGGILLWKLNQKGGSN